MTDKNKWVYNGVEFQVGDTVMVYFPEETGAVNAMGEGRAWENSWQEDMDFAIGGTFEIMEIREEGVEFVEYVDEAPSLHPHGGYLYPLSSLAKVGKSAPAWSAAVVR